MACQLSLKNKKKDFHSSHWTAPTESTTTAIYNNYRRRISIAVARGVALQIAIYALERRVGPATAASLRAAYPNFVNPPPCSIIINPPGQHASRRSQRGATRMGGPRSEQ